MKLMLEGQSLLAQSSAEMENKVNQLRNTLYQATELENLLKQIKQPQDSQSVKQLCALQGACRSAHLLCLELNISNQIWKAHKD